MVQSMETIKRLERRFKNKPIPVSQLGIKSWGTVDYAKKINYFILLDWRK